MLPANSCVHYLFIDQTSTMMNSRISTRETREIPWLASFSQDWLKLINPKTFLLRFTLGFFTRHKWKSTCWRSSESSMRDELRQALGKIWKSCFHLATTSHATAAAKAVLYSPRRSISWVKYDNGCKSMQYTHSSIEPRRENAGRQPTKLKSRGFLFLLSSLVHTFPVLTFQLWLSFHVIKCCAYLYLDKWKEEKGTEKSK